MRSTRREVSPEWLATVVREAAHRGGLILHGNVRDRFHTGEGVRYTDLASLLQTTLHEYDVRAVWDQVDGLCFQTRQMERRWQDALIAGREQAGTGGSPAGESVLGSPELPPSATADLHGLLHDYRTVLREGSLRVLLIVDWAHLLASRPAEPDAEDRAWMTLLGKALAGDPVETDRATRKGLLVFLTARLEAIPPVLYQGEPRVRTVAVPPPGYRERENFLHRHVADLEVKGDRREAIEVLAAATDGLSCVDLHQVLEQCARAKEQDGARLTAEQLITRYRFGEKRSPWDDLPHERVAEAERLLGERVLGQERAVRHAATMIQRASLGLSGLQHSARRQKPKGTLFLVGPTGVGKTELAKAMAGFLFGDESACIRFDMSEYNHEHGDQRLVGAPPGYVGFEEGGQLTRAVTERPFSVLLFDEIEKAHGRVLDKFLQVLEDGRLTDGRGETAWFSESVLVFTSNIGAANAPFTGSEPDFDEEVWKRHFTDAVERHFHQELNRPELLNRLGDNIVVFDPLRDEAIKQSLLRVKLKPLIEHMRDRWNVEVRPTRQLLELVCGSARASHGGRGLLNALERVVINPLTRELVARDYQLVPGRTLILERGADDILHVEWQDA